MEDPSIPFHPTFISSYINSQSPPKTVDPQYRPFYYKTETGNENTHFNAVKAA